MKVSILTATLPERAEMLAEAKASVLAQRCLVADVEHLIATDWDREGAAPILNRLLVMAEGDWVMVLDDDDMLDSHHVDVVATAAHEAVEVVYSMPRVTGGMFTQYHEPFDAAILARRNIVSHNALMRTSLVRQVGGWRPMRTYDWDLFQRLEAAGADFLQIPEVTWTYRLHGSNWSQGNLEGAPS